MNYCFFRSNSKESMDTDDKYVIRLLEKCDPAKQESLDSENVPDPMDAEQTWPTEEEIQMAQEENKVNMFHLTILFI